MQPILELKALSKSFGGLRAVRGVDLAVMPGDRMAVIGPNGAGKTTLFNLVTGILPSTSGAVLLFGRDVTRWPSHCRAALGMARTFQVTSLFPRLTVIDNVLLAIEGLRRTKFVMWRPLASYRDVQEKAQQLLADAGFLDRRDVEVRYLSHGEQRQLEIVVGLAGDPKILLLDEPAAGLDLGGREELVSRLEDLAADPDAPAIVLVTHHVEEIPRGFSHALILSEGKVVDAGLLTDVLNAENLSKAFGQSIALEVIDGRYFARRTRSRAAHRRR